MDALALRALEIPVEFPPCDVVAELDSLLDRVAEVEAEPHSRVDDLALDVVDAVEVLRRRQEAASVLSAWHRDVEVLRVQRRGQSVGEGGGEASVLRRILRVTRHTQQR